MSRYSLVSLDPADYRHLVTSPKIYGRHGIDISASEAFYDRIIPGQLRVPDASRTNQLE